MPPGFGGGGQVGEFRLRFERCCFLALLKVDMHLFQALWKELRLPSVGFALHEAKGSCFRTTALRKASVNHGRRDGRSTEDEMMLEKIAIGDQLKFDGCLKTLPLNLSEMPDSTALRCFFNNSQRCLL